MKLTINHLTRYRYNEQVKFSTQYLHLTPRDSARQRVASWSLTLSDGSTVATTDTWGNVLHVLTLDYPHQEIVIHAQGVVDIADNDDSEPEDELLSPLVFLRKTPLTQADAPIRVFALRYYRPEAAEESLNALMAALLVCMPYTPGATQV